MRRRNWLRRAAAMKRGSATKRAALRLSAMLPLKCCTLMKVVELPLKGGPGYTLPCTSEWRPYGLSYPGRSRPLLATIGSDCISYVRIAFDRLV
ncbi:hypothetical protein GE061_006761 [Apolygus lucorum]|uniref:Uncharacterized protein n=1 Tax=Apolygus lucorum TaxID=248454 RepID=A0A8S9WRC9_APOLU|nr:hypothetical protein GE061_006761 [Apolygus lucorum]